MATPVPFTDIGKPLADLLGKDYPVGIVKLEAKSTTPSGVEFTATGAKDNKSGQVKGELKTKYTDKKNGITFTESWDTANVLTGEVELVNTLARGLKLAVNASLLPAVGKKNAKVIAEYKQSNVHTRANLDLFKGPTFAGDAVVGHDGFLLGGDIAYDILDGRITRYNAALGYSVPEYSVALHASVFSRFLSYLDMTICED
ncbi:MAG: eukaryotic porin/Tom40 [Olpidium bornovanus]|uniref:Eukaryotic porin/Tom40 n=1 Tax=Olpidium bornovanus TaxID=278681 RepID=A0A8H8DH61_9FUNG|nr:MAG: eukaryotic porin/Tom40 [Olpidium bornovanus]